MHLYRAQKPGKKFTYPTTNVVLSNSDHQSIIIINSPLTVTVPVELKNDFYCQVKVLLEGTCRLIFVADVTAPEGTFIESGVSFEICGNGVDDGNLVEVVRLQPIRNDNFFPFIHYEKNNRIINPGLNNTPYTKIRVHRGNELLGEYPKSDAATMITDNINNDLLTIKIDTNKIVGSITLTSTNFMIYGPIFDLRSFDLSQWDGVIKLTGATNSYVHDIYGYETILNRSDLNFEFTGHKFNQIMLKDILDNFNGTRLSIGQDYGDYQTTLLSNIPLVTISDRPNLVEFKTNHFIRGGHHDIVIENNPIMTHINMYGYETGSIVNNVTITNCPSLIYVKIDSIYRYAQSVVKNFDSFMDTLDSNGLSNGTVILSSDFVFTAASDVSRANLLTKGWTLTLASIA